MQTIIAGASKPRGKLFRHTALVAVLLMSLTTGALAQQIYGWTDSNGQVTYSNLPPPKGAKVTDIILDTPLSPQAVQEAARRSEISALNDRIRLLELEQARSKREVVDYAPQPAPPLSAGCGPEGQGDCNYGYSYQGDPYYTTGLLYGTGRWRDHDGHDHGYGNGHPGRSPIRLTPPPKPQATPIAASPNRSSLQQR